MSFGFETYRADGSLNMSSATASGVFIEVLAIDYTSVSGSKSYPMIPAGELKFFNIDSPGHIITVDFDGNGHARINWSGGGTYADGTSLMVFAKKLNEVSTYGLTIKDASGQVVADYNYPVPRGVSTITPYVTAGSSANTPDGMTAHNYSFTTLGSGAGGTYQPIPAGTIGLLVMHCPNTSADTWYHCSKNFIRAHPITGSFNFDFTVYAPTSTAYLLPSFHIYSVNAFQSYNNSYGVQLYAADGSMVFNSAAENLTAADTLSVSYPAFGSVNTYTPASIPTNAGIMPPFYSQTTYTAVSGGYTRDRYFSVVRRTGSQFQFKLLRKDSTFVTSTETVANSAPNTNTYCVVMDLNYMGATTATGVAGTITTGAYSGYLNLDYIEIFESQNTPTYEISSTGSTAGPWFTGAGDSNLYECMVTLDSGTYVAASGYYRAVNTWYSLDASNVWGQAAPAGFSGGTRVGNFSLQIRLKSSLQVVSTGTFTLNYDRELEL